MNDSDDLLRLAAALGESLLARSWWVTSAESCTGGGIASAITSVPGSSGWFGAGFVTYSNTHKHEILGVAPAILDTYGAVSREVVEAMARGALDRAGADIAVAVSGIAGPDGGTDEKPVGTVWIAWTTAENTRATCYHFDGDRTGVRLQTVIAAMEGLLDTVKSTV